MSFIRNLVSRWQSHLPPSDQTEEILGRHLDRDFIVFPMAEKNVSVVDVALVGDQYGVKFPPEFCGHVCGKFPGTCVEVRGEIWPRPQLYDVAPFCSFLYGLHTFTPCLDSEEWMRLDHAAAEFRTKTGHKAAPIMRIVGDADVFCVDGVGRIMRFNHETSELTPEEIGFWELFEREVRALKERKIRKAAGA